MLLAGCGFIGQTHVEIEWVDFLQMNDKKYHRAYHLELAGPLGDKIGETKFKIADNIHNPEYRSKNGDSAYLKPGTELFSVKNKKDLIAVKNKEAINGYSIYSLEEPYGSGNFTDFPVEGAVKAEVYQEIAYNQYDLLRTITDKSELKHLLEMLSSGRPGEPVAYDDSNENIKSYAIVLYTSDPVCWRYSILTDGTVYTWSPWESEILPDEIQSILHSEP